MGILREDQEEVAVADDGVDARAVGIPRGILHLVVRDGLGNLRKRLAANEFRALEGELDVDIPPMGLIPFRVHEAGGVLADNGFDAQVQRMRADLHVRRDGRDIIQCQVNRRRQALIQADVLDVVVNHRMNRCCFVKGFKIPVSRNRSQRSRPEEDDGCSHDRRCHR